MQLETMYTKNIQPKFWAENKNNCRLNCGSFALGVDSWYSPYIDDDDDLDADMWEYSYSDRKEWIEDMVYEGYDLYEIIEYVVERDFEFILKTCPWLEPIQKEDISNEDRVIAYRISLNIPEERLEFDADEDMDFHFRVQINGEWWEKNGSGSAHFVSNEIDEEPWENCEFLIYDGAIKYARFRKENE